MYFNGEWKLTNSNVLEFDDKYAHKSSELFCVCLQHTMQRRKPLIVNQDTENLKWTHTAVLALLRSATQIFLVKILSKQHDMNTKMLQQEEEIVGGLQEAIVWKSLRSWHILYSNGS